MTDIEIPRIEPAASPATSTPWVPLWPLGGQTLGELAYAQITALVTVTATTEATATPIVAAPAITCDGLTPIVVEFFSPSVGPPANVSGYMSLILFDGNTPLGIIANQQSPANTYTVAPATLGRLRLTPSAGAHTYSVRGVSIGGSGNVYAGAGGPADNAPAHIRITLASPISNAPAGALMPVQYGTTLPGSPVNGQEAILVDSLTAPTYQWRFRYNAGSASAYKWEFIGGSDASHAIATQEALGTASAWANLATNGPLIVVPRAGEYRASYSVLGVNSDVNSATVYAGIAVGDTDTFDYGGGQCWFINGVAGSVPASGEVKTTLAAGDTLKLRYFSSNAVSKAFANRNLHVRPVRVA